MIDFLEYNVPLFSIYVRCFLLPYTLVMLFIYAWYGIILYCFYRARKTQREEKIKFRKKIIKAATYIFMVPAVACLLLFANTHVISYFDQFIALAKKEMYIYLDEPFLLVLVFVLTILVVIGNKLKTENVKTLSDMRKKKILCLNTEDILLVFAFYPIAIIMFFLFNLIHSTLSLFVIPVFFFIIGTLIFAL